MSMTPETLLGRMWIPVRRSTWPPSRGPMDWPDPGLRPITNSYPTLDPKTVDMLGLTGIEYDISLINFIHIGYKLLVFNYSYDTTDHDNTIIHEKFYVVFTKNNVEYLMRESSQPHMMCACGVSPSPGSEGNHTRWLGWSALQWYSLGWSRGSFHEWLMMMVNDDG